jgi:hypothetical protein
VVSPLRQRTGPRQRSREGQRDRQRGERGAGKMEGERRRD